MENNYICRKSVVVAGREVYTAGKTYTFKKVKEGMFGYRLEGIGNGGMGVWEKRDKRRFDRHFRLAN